MIAICVKAALLGIVAWLLRRTAAARYAWLTVLAAMLILPLPAWFAPPLHVAFPATVVAATRSLAPTAAPAVSSGWRVLYAAIASIMLVRLAIAIVMVRRLILGSDRIDDDVRSADVRVPVTAGFLRPQILLPRSWHEWSEAKLQAVLAHERHHVRRRDPLVQLLAEVNQCVYWFHPVAWIVPRELSRLSEEACDESAIAVIGRRTYAEQLLDVAGAMEGQRFRIGVAMAHSRGLARRIDTILGRRRGTAQLGRTGRAIAVGAMLVTIALFSIGASPAGIDTKETFVKRNETIEYKLLLAGAPARVHLRVDAAVRNGSIRWQLFDPTGAVRQGIGTTDRAVDEIDDMPSIKGEWRLRIAFADATGSLNVRWRP